MKVTVNKAWKNMREEDTGVMKQVEKHTGHGWRMSMWWEGHRLLQGSIQRVEKKRYDGGEPYCRRVAEVGSRVGR